MQRFDSLDWLRGLMALTIMVYHYGSWLEGGVKAGTLLGNLGVYGVSVFFVLSGLSMALVYHANIHNIATIAVFWFRRLFRLLPLLWLCIVIVVALKWHRQIPVDWNTVALNVTLLFGFFSPAQYINVGAWSIGNECVYYAFTPIFLMAYQHSKWCGNVLVALCMVVGGYFAFGVLDASKSLPMQWSWYVNPFNNLMLYACGVALYYHFHDVVLGHQHAMALIVLSTICLAWYPVNGSHIHIVTGINRVIFCMAAVALTLGFYKLNVDLPMWLAKPLTALGTATYGVYLLHPIVFQELGAVLGWQQSYWTAIVCGMISVVLAHFVYHLYEKPWIRLGKKVTAKMVQ